MLVEIEVREDSRGLEPYCGEIDDTVLEEVVGGNYAKAFVHLRNVFWPAKRIAKDEFDNDIDYVQKLGTGDRQNYVGDMYIKKVDIILISPLKAVAHRDGRKLGDLTAEKKKGSNS